MIVDSHAHLDFDAYGYDLDQVLERAWQAGLENIVAIGSGQGTEGALEIIALAARNQRIFCTLGVHPHDAALDLQWEGDPESPVTEDLLSAWQERRDLLMARMSALVLHPKVVAVGEVGLDYHHDHAPRQLQRELFRSFVRLAVKRGLPLVIHSREAEQDTADILREEGTQKAGGVIHCYEGSQVLAEAAFALNLHFGIAGPITYKKADSFRARVAELPLESLLVETDCPFLTPEPYRGKRNEPKHVALVVKRLAQIKSLDPELVGRKTAENARRLFRIDEKESSQPGRVVYPLKNSLYINLTNRCTQSCQFCLKSRAHEIAGMSLALLKEPGLEEVIAELENQLCEPYNPEVVFCGIGEPLLRLEEVKQISAWLCKRGIRARVNTDGLASLVHGRCVPAELAGLVGSVSVSLNAPDAETHARLCPSAFGKRAFEAVCGFISQCKQATPHMIVQATAVEVPGLDLEKTRRLAESLGASFRIRRYLSTTGD